MQNKTKDIIGVTLQCKWNIILIEITNLPHKTTPSTVVQILHY